MHKTGIMVVGIALLLFLAANCDLLGLNSKKLCSMKVYITENLSHIRAKNMVNKSEEKYRESEEIMNEYNLELYKKENIGFQWNVNFEGGSASLRLIDEEGNICYSFDENHISTQKKLELSKGKYKFMVEIKKPHKGNMLFFLIK